MNRVDLAFGLSACPWADLGDQHWVAERGRTDRKRARLNRDSFEHRYATAITTRLEGWRKQGEPRGYAFDAWTQMPTDAFRHQCHLAASRGSRFAQRQLALVLIGDLR